MKKGYTIIELMMVLGCLVAVLIGGFTLYQLYTSIVTQQVEIVEQSTDLTSLYLTLDEEIKEATYIHLDPSNTNLIDLGNKTISIEGNTIYLGTKPLITVQSTPYFEVDASQRSIKLIIGGVELCFSRISTEV